MYTYIEPCCGSAAIALHLLGARKLVPYQGTKWGLREPIGALFRELGFTGRPSAVVLSDASPWAETIALAIARPGELATVVRQLVEAEPQATYDRLAAAPVPVDPLERAAALLWLQRMSYQGKAVGDSAGRWRLHGLSHTCAYGLPACDTFGPVLPQGPTLLAAIQALDPQPGGGQLGLSLDLRRPSVAATTGLVEPPASAERTLVYLDPPYRGSTGYAADLPRDEVVAYARAWARAGAVVVVSEAEPIAELEWPSRRIREGTRQRQRQRMRSRGEEWVTYSRGP